MVSNFLDINRLSENNSNPKVFNIDSIRHVSRESKDTNDNGVMVSREQVPNRVRSKEREEQSVMYTMGSLES